MVTSGTCDLFITHAWRYHQDWKHVVDLLNAHSPRGWRNFSLPWYDPALDPRTEKGGTTVRWQLEAQIMPVHAVLLLAGVMSEPGTRKWLDFELATARKHNKPVLVLPPWGETQVPEAIASLAIAVVPWDAAALLAAIQRADTTQSRRTGDGNGTDEADCQATRSGSTRECHPRRL